MGSRRDAGRVEMPGVIRCEDAIKTPGGVPSVKGDAAKIGGLRERSEGYCFTATIMISPIMSIVRPWLDIEPMI